MLLPVLREADWNGRSLAAARVLFGEKVGGAFIPWVTFAYDEETQTLTLTEEGLRNEQRSLLDVEREALAALSARGAAWEVKGTDATGAEETLSLLDEYAAAHLLLGARLDEAHRRLKAERLVVAIPTRGILVTRGWPEGDGEAEVTDLLEWANVVYRDSHESRVSPALFEVRGGSVVGIVRPAPRQKRGPRVEFLAYDAEEGVADFSCRLEEGESLSAKERSMLSRVVGSGRLDTDQSVDEVRVVFESREAARRGVPELAGVEVVFCVRGAEGEVTEWDPR